MKKALCFLVISVIFFTGFKKQPAQKVTVAVAANMQYAMKALEEKFEKETGIIVEVIFGSSGKLTQQIEEGAPYDVFVSADTKYPAELFNKKFTAGSPRKPRSRPIVNRRIRSFT